MTRKPESAWLIPSDFDLATGSWKGICLQWPDSEQWDDLLRALLYTLARGRSWDRESGVIRDAQDIGWEIFERNHDNPGCGNTPCPDCPDCANGDNGDIPPLNGGWGGLFSAGDEEMPCIDITSLLKIENGVLYARNACCEWERVGDIFGQVEPIGDETLPPIPDGQTTYSTCGKAQAAYDVILAVGDAIWDERTNVNVLQWVGHVEEAVPGWNLSNNWITTGILFAIELDLLFSVDEVFDTTTLADVKCQIDNAMSADSPELTATEYRDIFSIFKNQFGGLIGEFWVAVIEAIGEGNLNNAAKLGATNYDATCLCAEEAEQNPTTPDAQGWYMGANLADQIQTIEGNLDMIGYWQVTPAEDVYGALIKIRSANAGASIRLLSQTYSSGGQTAPQSPAEITGNSLNNMEGLNQSAGWASVLTLAIRNNLAAQLGLLAVNSAGSGMALNSTVIASPALLAGAQATGVLVWTKALYTLNSNLFVEQFRLIHNTNSPSHG